MAPLRLLLIEDSDDDAALLIRALRRAGYDVTTHQVETAEQLNAALDAHTFDLAIADHRMPLFSGTRARNMIRARAADLPFMFVSGTIGEVAAVAAMKDGACDYIVKGDLSRLPAAVANALREGAARCEQRLAEARVKHLAFFDVLTGLPNRAMLAERLDEALAAARRHRSPLALLVLDLDGFKAVNDTYGHEAGDEALRQVAVRLTGTLSPTDTVARLGGDEFAVLLPGSDPADAEYAAHKIVQALGQPYVIAGRALSVQGSIGIANWTADGDSETLRQRADAAMYHAKRDGSGYAVFEESPVFGDDVAAT